MHRFYTALQRTSCVYIVINVLSCLSEVNGYCKHTAGNDYYYCNSSICGRHLNTSCSGVLCSFQFLAQPLTKDSLESVVYGGRPYEPECDKNPSTFEGSATSKLGRVQLQVYRFRGCWNDFTWTKSAFNITFLDIKWTSAHIRFQNLYNASDHFILFHKNFTRRKEDNVSQFFYDCFWNIQYDHSVVKFQYKAQDDNIVEVREFRFEIPTYEEVETKPFMYIDVTDRQVLTLWWQGNTRQNYSVELLQDEKPISENLFVGASSNRLLSYSSPPVWSGVYRFRLKVLGQNEIYLSEKVKIVTNNTTVLAVGVVVGILVVCFLLFIIFINNRKLKGNPPTVLITYIASNDSHVKVVKALTGYMQEYCNVTSYLDYIDIPNSGIEDPLIWYMKSFAQVKYVMIVSSPQRCQCSGSAGVTYRNMDLVALSLIREVLARGLKTPKIFCVTLPYSSNFPDEASFFQKFDLLREMDSMLKFLHEASCLQFCIPGGKKDLTKYGHALLNAIKEAQHCSSKCSCGGKQEVCTNEDIQNLLSRLEQMQQEDNLLVDSNTNEEKCTVLNIPYPNTLKALNLSGTNYSGMFPKRERAEELPFNIRNWKLK